MPFTRSLLTVCKRRYSTSVSSSNLVLGCGSNVVDQFFMVQVPIGVDFLSSLLGGISNTSPRKPALPKVGEKGYFASPNKIHEKSIVGGVTLNHLSWASILGVPTGLLGLQGDDPSGQLIRKTMKSLQVSDRYVQVRKEYTTGESFVFVQEDGERSIVMARGGTSLINDELAKRCFENAIKNDCQMLTTEISQVPLSGVLAVLHAAKAAGVTTVLDLDVSPSVAINEAKLGTLEELTECVKMADVLKPAKHAAQEMVSYMTSFSKIDNMVELTKVMREACGSKLLAITCGEESSILATDSNLVEVAAVPVSNVVDATGAGDAFLGGLVSGLYYHGLPTDETSLRKLGEIGNIVGSACCEVLGALPTLDSRKRLRKELDELLEAEISVSSTARDEETSKSLEAFKESLQLDAQCATKVLSSLKTSEVRRFINSIEKCTGRVLVSGIGKSAIVAQRMSSSLSSTGTPSHFVHATEWVHGELGNALPGDVVVFLSHSGNTAECVRVAEILRKREISVLAIVGKDDCALKQLSDVLLSYDNQDDLAETLSVVPSRSILIQEMLVNGIVSELIRRRNFTLNDFGRFHPGGSLGEKLR